MSVELIYVKGKSNSFAAEKDLVSGGILISQFFADGRRESIARIIDDGRDFSLMTYSERTGIHIDYLSTVKKTILKDGSVPPHQVHEQVEIITKHNRKLIIRPLRAENNNGVIILYSDEDSVFRSLAVFSIEPITDSVLISLPKIS